MELLQSDQVTAAAAPFTARYCATLWEPLPGTGERIVALVSVESHESTSKVIAPGTYLVISAERLRRLLGRQRATAAHAILLECAQFMTTRQQAGQPLEELKPLFQGFQVGPAFVARAYSVEQLLSAAVRSISAFGSADGMIEEEEQRQSPRHMIRTAEFLAHLRRIVTATSKDFASRFDVPLPGRDGVPEVVIDYADGPLAVQVTSLPVTPRQVEHSEREANAKMFELDVARSQMAGNHLRATVLVNTDALASDVSAEGQRHAAQLKSRVLQFARHKGFEVLEADSPADAVELLERMAR
jgi:hypothetical protein